METKVATTFEDINFSDKFKTTTVKDAHIRASLYHQGTQTLAYKVWYKGKVLFYGDDFRPGIFTAFDSKDTIMGLLHFFAVGEDDTDEEFFQHYSEEQMSFVRSKDREELSYVLSDWEEKKEEN